MTMNLGDHVRLEESCGERDAGTVGIVVGFFRNGQHPDALVSFGEGEPAVLPVGVLTVVEARGR
jgi:hypothetical protein